MKFIRFSIVLLLTITAISITVFSKNQKRITRADRQTESFVEQAARVVSKKGRVAAACEFNNVKGPFQRSFHYVFAVTCGNTNKDDDGFIIADPATPEYNYTNRKNKSLIIKKIIQDSHQILHSSGKWYEYCWMDPVTHKAELKRSYVIMVPKENLCIGSGYYLQKPCTFKG